MFFFVFSFPILLSIIVDCFIRSGHNSWEEGLSKSISVAVEQSPGEDGHMACDEVQFAIF